MTYTIDKLRQDIEALVQYNWKDEERDYLACLNPDNENSAEGHIFETIQWLWAFVNDGPARHITRIEGVEGVVIVYDPDLGHRLYDTRAQRYVRQEYDTLGEATSAAVSLGL